MGAVVMDAVVLSSAEDTTPEVVQLPVPEPGPGEVRIKVAAASVNGFDLAVAAGYTKAMMEHRYPLVLGKDFAGTVDTVGPDVTDFAAGDRVFGTVTKSFLGDGSFAEYVTVPVAIGVAPLPDGVSFTEGAALGLASVTAYTAVRSASIGPESSVLVVGATGGVGVQVVQLAAAQGATVAATASNSDGAELVRKLGAVSVIDRKEGAVADQAAALFPDGVDVVIHLAGEPTVVSAAADGATFVSTLVYDPAQVPSSTVTVAPVMANPEPALLGEIAAAHQRGDTTTVIQQSFPLAETGDALAAFGAGTRGKIVITVGSDADR